VVIQGYARQKITSYHAGLAFFHIDMNQMNVFHNMMSDNLLCGN